MAEKTDVVIYIDRASVEHKALVVGVNNLNPDVLDVTYFDLKSDALKTEFGVPHMSDDSKKETNPTLPQYSLNCWKKDGEEHLALPVDHPANDHPFELKKQDDSGRIVTKPRPEFEKHLAEVAAADPSLSVEGRAIAEQTGEIPVENVAKPLPPVEVKPESPIKNTPVFALIDMFPLGSHLRVSPNAMLLLTESASEIHEINERELSAEESEMLRAGATIIHGRGVWVDTSITDDNVVLLKEPDVTAQLDAAGPAPVVEEKKPDDAA